MKAGLTPLTLAQQQSPISRSNDRAEHNQRRGHLRPLFLIGEDQEDDACRQLPDTHERDV